MEEDALVEAPTLPVPQGLEESSEAEDRSRVERRRDLARRLVDGPHRSAMLEKFGIILRFISRILFAHVLFEQRCVDNIRDAHRRGAVVYVMHSRSLLDYLYYNWAFLRHDLPIARFSNGMKTHWLRGFFAWVRSVLRRRRPEKSEEQMQALVASDEPVFLFLERPKARSEENVEFSQKYLYRLIRAQRALDHPIFVLPMLLVWERRPESRHVSLIEEIFGTVQSPGFFRKFLYWFQTIWQSFLRFGQPIAQVSTGVDLQQFLREYPDADTADASELLRERLLEHIEQERRVILGPVGETPTNLWREISQRPELTATVRAVAAEEEAPETEIMQRARAQFEEIAAEPSLLVLKIFSSILSLVWYRIYDGFEVDEEGLERVREVAKTSSIVLIPSHKSHVDYLIISYLFYHYGLNNPLIAAGNNLSFWPMGWLFRRAGAFFIRRSFKGEVLYTVVFREYLVKLMEEGYPIEFFIEGTRSRTGKLIKPKYGMLDMIVRAFASGRVESVKLIPISVGYEKIIEERAYRQELLGGEKERESLGGLLRTPKFLTSKYGRLYVEFNEPIDLQEYLVKYELDRMDPAMIDERAEDVDALTVRLAHRIIYDINRVTTVAPTALAALVLLNNEARGIDRQRFLQEVGFLLRFLTEPDREVRLSRTLRDALSAKRASIKRLEDEQERKRSEDGLEQPDAASRSTERNPAVESVMGHAVAELMDQSLELFEDTNHIEITRSDEQIFYSVPEDARVELSYYRNTIVHHFVPEALLASAIRSFETQPIPLEELMRETLFLSRLFKYEWIYEERAEFENVFLRTLRYFESSGWITLEDAQAEEEHDLAARLVRVGTPTPVEIEFFRRLVLTFLEAYTIVVGLLERLADRPMEKNDFIKMALKQARNDYLAGRVLFQESLSKPTYQNALRLLTDWGVLTRHQDESKRRDTYELSEEFRDPQRLHALHAHLEQFVYPGRTDAVVRLGNSPEAL